MTDSADERAAELERDGPADELEPGAVVAAELERLVGDPRAEEQRLKQVAAAGEEAATVGIEVVLLARWLIPIVLVMAGIALGIYFAVR
jgi:hypothetical protein